MLTGHQINRGRRTSAEPVDRPVLATSQRLASARASQRQTSKWHEDQWRARRSASKAFDDQMAALQLKLAGLDARVNEVRAEMDAVHVDKAAAEAKAVELVQQRDAHLRSAEGEVRRLERELEGWKTRAQQKGLAALDASDVFELVNYWLEGVPAGVAYETLQERGITGAALAQGRLTEAIMERDLRLHCLGHRRRIALGLARLRNTGAVDSAAPPVYNSPGSWTVRQVQEWLRGHPFSLEVQDRFSGHAVDGSVLLTLTSDELAAMGLARQSRERLRQVLGPLQPAGIASAPPAAVRSAPWEPIPESWYCPLTHEVMRDPVMLADSTSGHSYEREAIEAWLERGSLTDPMTNMTLTSGRLIPNRNLKEGILAHAEHHALASADTMPPKACRPTPQALAAEPSSAAERLQAEQPPKRRRVDSNSTIAAQPRPAAPTVVGQPPQTHSLPLESTASALAASQPQPLPLPPAYDASQATCPYRAQESHSQWVLLLNTVVGAFKVVVHCNLPIVEQICRICEHVPGGPARSVYCNR